MRQKINFVTLGVLDLKRALDFYEKGLGWKKSSVSQEGFAVFNLGSIALGLYPLDLLAEDAHLKAAKPGAEFNGIALSYNARSQQEVDTVLQQVQSLGAVVCKAADKTFWGGYSGYFRDLDGYVFEVCYNPFWPLDAQDNLKLD